MTMNTYHHCKRILIVEDDKNTVDILKYNLSSSDIDIFVVSNLEDAKQALEDQHFHVAVVDLSLTGFADNYDGMEVLDHILNHYPRNTILQIVLTARDRDGNRILKIKQDYKVEHYVEKNSDYGSEVADHIQEYFDDTNHRIKFDLDYQDAESYLMEIASDLAHRDTDLSKLIEKIGKDKVIAMLYQEIRDILGHFFHDAEILHIEPMTPGMTASAVLKVRPILSSMQDNRYVIKFGRRDKIEEEQNRYNSYATRLHDPIRLHPRAAVFKRYLGGLGYRLATNEVGNQIVEFDWLYRNGDLSNIRASFKQFFEETLHNWYRHQNPIYRMSLVNIYAKALNLGGTKTNTSPSSEDKINDQNFRAHLLRLYESMGGLLRGQDLNGTYVNISFANGTRREITNPLQWIKDRLELLKVPVSLRVTHGDLTGRNLMVDRRTTMINSDTEDDGTDKKNYHRMQLIDFYRTGLSHVLRDVVILETDLKFRLYRENQDIPMEEFEAIEKRLLRKDVSYNWNDEARRLVYIVDGLRKLSQSFDSIWNETEAKHQYFIALILTTMNITRFQRMSEERRRQAILSASMICDWLSEHENYPRVVPTTTSIAVKTRTLETRVIAHANESYLDTISKKLKSDQALLFIGNYLPEQRNNERSLQGLASRLDSELAAKVPYHKVNGTLSPAQIFDRYESETGREVLLQKYREYFAEQQTVPDYLLAAAELPWSCVYTTNQHDFFEKALHHLNKPYTVINSNVGQLSKNGILSIHKMCSSLNLTDAKDPTKLPMTTFDYTMHVNVKRLNSLSDHMWQQVELTNPDKGPILVMLFPSPADIDYYENEVQDKSSTGSRVYVLDDAPLPKYTQFIHIAGSTASILHHLAERCK